MAAGERLFVHDGSFGDIRYRIQHPYTINIDQDQDKRGKRGPFQIHESVHG